MMKRNNYVARRTFVKTGLMLPAAGFTSAGAATQTSSEVYAKLGVRTFINAVGTLTTLSGTLIAPEVVQAMEQASRNFVVIHELQDKVGKRLAELTGAQAAFVTAGASAALCLASCAVTAGKESGKRRHFTDPPG